MSYLERVVADSADRENWMLVRTEGIGASDAANFAKLESVERYVLAKLKSGEFRGNAYTGRGNNWEESIVRAAGFEQNTLMFRSVEEPLFFATPDGIKPGAAGGITLAEAKTQLVKDTEYFDPATWVPKIPQTHLRQVAWAQMVLEADFSEYIVLPCDERHVPLLMSPRIIYIDRDEALIEKLLQIAKPVLAAMKAAAEIERQFS